MSFVNDAGETVILAPGNPPIDPERAALQQVEVIAEIGHAAVMQLEITQLECLGYDPEVEWRTWWDLSDDEQNDRIAGVRFILDNPALPLAAQHEDWIRRNDARLSSGDPRRRPFDELPFGQQLKARLWRHIVHAIVG